MARHLSLLLILLFALVSCSKEELKPLEGNYSGEFYSSGYPGFKISDTKINLRLEGQQYISNGAPDRYPAGGSGTYTLSGKQQILFEDKNIWTADFDWNLILNGKFDYKIKGDSLILTRYHQPCDYCSSIPKTYQYRLKRLD